MRAIEFSAGYCGTGSCAGNWMHSYNINAPSGSVYGVNDLYYFSRHRQRTKVVLNPLFSATTDVEDRPSK